VSCQGTVVIGTQFCFFVLIFLPQVENGTVADTGAEKGMFLPEFGIG
jgi:hypothetical protein